MTGLSPKAALIHVIAVRLTPDAVRNRDGEVSSNGSVLRSSLLDIGVPYRVAHLVRPHDASGRSILRNSLRASRIRRRPPLERVDVADSLGFSVPHRRAYVFWHEAGGEIHCDGRAPKHQMVDAALCQPVSSVNPSTRSVLNIKDVSRAKHLTNEKA